MAAGVTPAWRRFLAPLLAGALVAVLGLLLLRPAAGGGATAQLTGRPAPDFRLAALDGPAVQLSALAGRPVVLNFWASWCGPCREEAPLFAALSAREAAVPGGLAMVGLLFQETNEQSARTFIREYALRYPNVKDPGLDTGIRYGVSGIPVTVFVDRAGVVQHIEHGGLTRAELNAGLNKIGVAALLGSGE